MALVGWSRPAFGDIKGLFGWKSGKLGKWKISEMMEKLEDEKLLYLVETKSGRIKNVVYINWLLYSCYIIGKK